jgi:hypothetical protein
VANAGYRKEVASFLRVESLRSCLRIDDLHDLIINHIAPRATGIFEFGRFICEIVRDRQSAELFSYFESLTAILKCFHRSKTSQDAEWIAGSIDYIIYYNPPSNKLLNSLPVVEAFSFIIPLANDAFAVRSVSNALARLLRNEEAQKKFGTPEFLTIFQGMEKYATTKDSKASFASFVDICQTILVQVPLADSATSSQLKSAVDCLPQYHKYYSSRVRDLLIAKKDLIVDPETADSVVKFLSWFSLDESCCPLLRTKEVRDLTINNIAPQVTAIEQFGRLTFNIVQDRPSAELFSDVESFSAILKCFHRAKAYNDAYFIAASIHNIVNKNPSSNKLLNTLPVVEAFSFIIPLANDADAVLKISNALEKILGDNEKAEQKFATPEFFKIFQGMEKYATTDSSKIPFQNVLGFINPTDYSKPLADSASSSQLKSAVDSLPRHTKHFSSRVRDLLIAKKDHIVDAETADSVVNFLFSFSQVVSLRPLLRTKEVRDLIINHIAPRVTAIEVFGGLIRGLVGFDGKFIELFSNVESFSAILKGFHHSKTSQDAFQIASSIYDILYDNPSSNKLLNSLPVVEAFSFIIPLAKNSQTAQWISIVLLTILRNNEEAQQKFATPEFLKIFKGMEIHATTDKAKDSFQSVLGFVDTVDYSESLADASNSPQLKSVVNALPRHQKHFTNQVRDLLIAKKHLIVDAATADSVVNFLLSFSLEKSPRPLLQTKQVQDLIINNIAPHVTAISEFGSLIFNIAQDQQQSAKLFSNVESFTAILKCFHRSKTSNDARVIAASIYNILYQNPSSNKLFNSLPVVEAFSFIIPLANNADAVKWISEALQKVLESDVEVRAKFGTSEFLLILKGMEKHATTDESKTSFRQTFEDLQLFKAHKPLFESVTSPQMLKSAVDSLPRNVKSHPHLVDLIIAEKDFIVDAETADSVLKFLIFFSQDHSLCPLLRTREVRDLIINNIAPHVKVIRELGGLICRIVRDEKSAKLFSSVESFSAILKCFHRLKASWDAQCISNSINNILAQNPSSNKLFNSLPVVEAFSFIIPLAKDDEAVRSVSNALARILTSNEEAQTKFATPEFLKIFNGMQEYSMLVPSNKQFQTVLELLMQK